MKRALLWGATLLGASVLAGCPIYPDQPYACATNSECPSGYACNPSSGVCYATAAGGGGYGGNGTHCNKPSDCGPNETCTQKNECRIGDCTFHGCVSGYACKVVEGSWACIPANSSGGSSGSDGAAGSGGAAGAAGASSGGSAGASSGGAAGSSTGGSAGANSGGSAGASTGGSAGATSTGGTTGDASSDVTTTTDAGSDASSDGA